MATRKIPREVQNQDEEQLKILFGGSSVKPVQQNIQNTQVEQIQTSNMSNLSNSQESKSVGQEKQIETVAAEPDEKIITEENKPVSDTTVGIRMTTAKKREMKAYFIQHGTTMSQGVLDSFALLRTLEAEGLIVYKDGLLKRV